MKSDSFKPRTGTYLAYALYALSILGAVVAIASGWQNLLLALPLLALIAFCGYWLFQFPEVKINEDAVTFVNPGRTVTVPWAGIITVDTRFALTLVTLKKRFSAWAAPAPGVVSTYRSRPEDTKNLPSGSYGPHGSLRPGDLRRTDSGAAAFMVRTKWSQLIEQGKIDVDDTETTQIKVSWNLWRVGIAVVLLAINVAIAAVLLAG